MRSLLSAVLAAAALAAAAPATAAPVRTHWVPFAGSRLHVEDHPGREPAFVLMHGFPDDLHLYDRLVPQLRGRRVIAFDFLGWGRSGRPAHHHYTFAEQEQELDAVVRALGLTKLVPVGHDASGPAAINWTLDHPDGAAELVLLNTFYGVTPTLTAPQAITIFSTPAFAPLADAISADRRISKWLYRWQVGRFMSDPVVRRRTLDAFWPNFARSVPAFRSLNRDLGPAVTANTARAAQIATLKLPIRIIFGARDPYLNEGVARSLHELAPGSQLTLLPARHYVQVDRPAEVARAMTQPFAGT
jgi:pimeloyl-ACP methyl ester carboxylesterase